MSQIGGNNTYIFIFKTALNDVEFQLTHNIKSDLVNGHWTSAGSFDPSVHKSESGNQKRSRNVGGSCVTRVTVAPDSGVPPSNILSGGSMICPCITVLADSLLPWKYFIISVFPFVGPLAL